MLRRGTDLQGLKLRTSDGETGRVDHFLFDDERWVVRYMVVNTGNWLLKDLVLISPRSIASVDWHAQRIDVNLTRQQVENAPDIDAAQPVSRQMELRHAEYYNYDPYWQGPLLWGGAALPISTGLPGAYAPGPSSGLEREPAVPEQGTTHLRSTREVIDYHIQALDGDIGHLSDFVMDDESWAIRYFIVSTRNWWPGKHVVFSPHWIKHINWYDYSISVDLTRDQIKSGPEYDAETLNRDYEQRLYRHHGRQPYWEG